MSDSKVDIKVLWRILRLARPYRRLFWTSIILALLLAPLTAAIPYLINLMVDNHIFAGDMGGLRKMAFIFVCVLLISTTIQYVFIYMTRYLGQSIVRDLRVETFDHLTGLPMRFFDQTPIGKATTRTINDIETLSMVFTNQGLMMMLADILTIVAVLGAMLSTSVKLTLICLITMPFLILATYMFMEKVKRAFEKVRNEIAKMNAFLQERISGMKIVQIFNAERQEKDKFRTINRAYTRANLNTIFYYALFFPAVEIISAVSLALMVWWGARDVLSDAVTIGALVAFPMYLNRLFRPIRFLADKFNNVQMAMVAAQRVFDILDNNAPLNNAGSTKANQLRGDLSFQEVTFAYDGENDVLKNISFDVKAGQTIALVGSTGSGKTTIINLLSRMYSFSEGKILIDGIDIHEFDLFALRRRMGIVLQDVFLFTGTVMENIRLMNDDISEEQVKQAAQLVGAHDFITALPDAYDYQVLERGANLSVGQRQLISFVRALVFDPDILILDEATSSIDSETEAVIQYAIEQLISKRTSVIIAHRLSTIRHADQVLVLHKGEIKEKGKPDDLLNIRDGWFRKLHDLHFSQEVTID